MSLAIALALAAAAHAATLTVDADALRVRRRPDDGAEVVARLRMGTPVLAASVDGEWVQVRMLQDTGTTGWVHRGFLTDEPVELGSVRRAALAGDADAARRWFALDPADPQARELRMAQGNEGASWVAAWEEAPTWLAACGHSGAVLLGSVDARGTFRPAVGAHDAAALQALGEALAGAAWYAPGPNGGPLVGTPFPRPTPEAVVEVLAEAPTTVDTEDLIGEPATIGRVGLAGPDGRLVGAQGGLGHETELTWVELSGTDHPTLLGVSNRHGPLDSAVLLHSVRLTPAGAEVDVQSLSLWEGGC